MYVAPTLQDIENRIKTLIDNGKNLNARDTNGRTFLYKAAESSLILVKILIEKDAFKK